MKTAIRRRQLISQKGIKAQKRMVALLALLAMLVTLVLGSAISYASEEDGTPPGNQQIGSQTDPAEGGSGIDDALNSGDSGTGDTGAGGTIDGETGAGETGGEGTGTDDTGDKGTGDGAKGTGTDDTGDKGTGDGAKGTSMDDNGTRGIGGNDGTDGEGTEGNGTRGVDDPKYTIIFQNDNNDELWRVELEAGETPVYGGATPTKRCLTSRHTRSRRTNANLACCAWTTRQSQ